METRQGHKQFNDPGGEKSVYLDAGAVLMRTAEVLEEEGIFLGQW